MNNSILHGFHFNLIFSFFSYFHFLSNYSIFPQGKSDAKSSLKSDDYDIMVKELMFESKAKVS